MQNLSDFAAWLKQIIKTIENMIDGVKSSLSSLTTKVNKNTSDINQNTSDISSLSSQISSILSGPNYSRQLTFLSGRENTYTATQPCWVIINAAAHDSTWTKLELKAHNSSSWVEVMRQRPDYGVHGIATVMPLSTGDAVRVSSGRGTSDGISGQGSSIRVYACL